MLVMVGVPGRAGAFGTNCADTGAAQRASATRAPHLQNGCMTGLTDWGMIVRLSVGNGLRAVPTDAAERPPCRSNGRSGTASVPFQRTQRNGTEAVPYY